MAGLFFLRKLIATKIRLGVGVFVSLIYSSFVTLRSIILGNPAEALLPELYSVIDYKLYHILSIMDTKLLYLKGNSAGNSPALFPNI